MNSILRQYIGVLLFVLLFACNREEETPKTTNVELRFSTISIPSAVSASNTDDAKIESVKVWAFNSVSGELTGYHASGALPNAVQEYSFFMTLENVQTDFYIVLNERWFLSGEGEVVFPEQGTAVRANLSQQWFTGVKEVVAPAEQFLPIADAEVVNLPELGKAPLLIFRAPRSIVKYDFFFAKESDADQVVINGITLGKIADRGYVFPKKVSYPRSSPEDWNQPGGVVFERVKNLILASTPMSIDYVTSSTHVDGVLPTDAESWNQANILSSYLPESNRGIGNGITATVDYTLGGTSHSRTILLPHASRNSHMKIYTRVTRTGEIAVTYIVDHWKEQEIVLPPFN